MALNRSLSKSLQVFKFYKYGTSSCSRIPQVSILLKHFSKLVVTRKQASPSNITSVSAFSTSCTRYDLNEFFDDDSNWGESTVKVGRPWKLDELRIKSNTDLHKLWYVLLKERNMLLTMEGLYHEKSELFPSPERIFKVEESMENVLEVVKERDIAYNLLEYGKTGEPEVVTARNFLGLKHQRKVTEHNVPRHMNRIFNLLHPKYDKYFVQFHILHKEQLKKKTARWERNARKYKERMLEKFPHLKDNEDFMSEKKADSL